MKRALALSIAWVGLFSCLFAQSYQPFSQAKDWKLVSSDYFDLYYQDADEAGAELAIKFAEQARHELSVLYDIRPEDRYTLVYFAQALDLLYSNQLLPAPEDGPGLFGLPTHRDIVVHPGTTQGLYEEVKRAVSDFLLDELAYGERLGSALQTQLLLHEAAWFQQGLNDYVASGWTFQDEMLVHSLPSQEILSRVLDGDGEIEQTLRKSVWYFIAHEYGQQKLSEIVYLVHISNSIESGVVSVLGITLGTLTARWRDYLISRAEAQRQRRVNLEEWNEVDKVTLPVGYALVNFSLTPQTGQIAAWMHKRGALRLFVFEPEQHEWKGTPLRMGLNSVNADHLHLPTIPIAWSPDGRQLATIRYRPKGHQLIYFEPGSNDWRALDLSPSLRAVYDLTWSHDGASLAASALRNGRIDLFSIRAGEREFRPLTDDAYDDREPSWSFDDQRIFFTSNRDSTALDHSVPAWELREATFDIYALQRSDDPFLERLTETPFSNERKPMGVSSFQVKYLTDESGIWNLHAINIFLKKREIISNFDLGIQNWSGNEQQLLVASPYEGTLRLYQMPTSSLAAPSTPELTLLRLEQIAEFQTKARLQARKKAQAEAEAEASQPEPTPEPVEEEPETQAPSSEPEEEDQPVRYYIFDEEDQPYDIRRPSREDTSPTQPRRSSIPTLSRRHPSPPDLATLPVDFQGQAPGRWAADQIRLGFAYDPLAGLGLDLGLEMSDVLNHHKLEARFQPFVNTSFSTLRYTYRPGKIDWYGEAYLQRRLYRGQQDVLSDSLLFRYGQTRISGGMVYPLNAYAALNLQTGWHRLQRIDQQVRRTELFDAQENLLHLGASVHVNRVRYQEQYRLGGYEGQASWDTYFSLSQQNIAFHRFQAEVSHYMPVYKQIVLATRLGGSFTLPNDLTQFYLGGVDNQLLVFGLENTEENSVSVTSVDSSLLGFQYQDFKTTVRGFRPISREGSRYLVGNWELRIPISRMLRHSLNSNSLYSLELIPFLDVGAVWSEGNPFNQKKPTDTRIITSGNITIRLQTLKSPFLVGFGSGLRMNLLGYSLRGDLAWGVDDQTLKAPMIMLSLGKNF